MADRRRAGASMLIVGLVLAGIGTMGLAAGGDGVEGTAGGPDASATSGSSPEPTATPVPSRPATPVPSPTPTPTPSPDPDLLLADFITDLTGAIRAGAVGSLGARLHPAVIDRYGRAACDEQLASRAADPSFTVEIIEFRAPASWDYVTDELSTIIDGATAVNGNVTANGTPTARDLHFAIVDDTVLWFTDCGTPRIASPSPSS